MCGSGREELCLMPSQVIRQMSRLGVNLLQRLQATVVISTPISPSKISSSTLPSVELGPAPFGDKDSVLDWQTRALTMLRTILQHSQVHIG
jgi:hypothetical protein